MHIDLTITTSREYFNEVDKEVNWDEDDNTKVSTVQAEAIQKILTSEVSIHLLRRVSGICGSLVDDMVDTRRIFIRKYEQDYEPYIEYRDFY